MAEDAPEDVDLANVDADKTEEEKPATGDIEKKTPDKKKKDKKEKEYKPPPCNQRIEDLSRPKQLLLFTTLHLYHDTLPKERVDAIEQYLQEEMAAPAEEVAEKLKALRDCLARKKRTHINFVKAKQKIKDLSRKAQIKLMRKCVRETLKTAMYYAYFNPKQIIMSDRMRKLSSLIVRDICQLMKIKMPDRCVKACCKAERRSAFLYAIGDYFAYSIESLYFDIQFKSIELYEKERIIEKQKEEEEDEQRKERVARKAIEAQNAE